MSESDDNHEDGDGTLVVDHPPTEDKQRSDPPPRYAVVLLNDDFTPMDFVVSVLTHLFNKTQDEAEVIMTEVHEKGKGFAGAYPKDIALTKIDQVHNIAQHNQHPFRCEIEPLH
jgi:ATP-dependent Clp protease adaptor protein ClpS